MSTMNVLSCFAFLAIFLMVIMVISYKTKNKKLEVFFVIGSLILIFCLVAFMHQIHLKKEVIVKIIKIEDGYHLLCSDYKDLRKIAEVLPDASEEELKNMDINDLTLQMVVDWKVNKIAEDMEKKYGKVIAPKVHEGQRELKEISRDEIEKVIREHIFRCNEVEKHYHFSVKGQ